MVLAIIQGYCNCKYRKGYRSFFLTCIETPHRKRLCHDKFFFDEVATITYNNSPWHWKALWRRPFHNPVKKIEYSCESIKSGPCFFRENEGVSDCIMYPDEDKAACARELELVCWWFGSGKKTFYRIQWQRHDYPCHRNTCFAKSSQLIRTIREGIYPSEQITALALRNAIPEFLVDSPEDHILAKFIRDKIDLDRQEGVKLLAA